MRTLTQQELRREFGDPAPYLSADGGVAGAWGAYILKTIPLPAPIPLAWDRSIQATRLSCHQRIASLMGDTLRAVHAEPEVWATINDWGGCYLFRANRRDPKRLSAHSWGVAIDWDVAQNHQGDATPEVHPRLIEIMAAHSFIWGGLFSGRSIDPMHWEVSDETLARLEPRGRPWA